MDELERLVYLEHRLAQATSLISELVDDEDCWVDHHGYCQAHRLHKDSKCPHKLAKEWLKDA